MKRMTMILVALIGSALMVSAVASAAKPNKEAKKLAQQQCKAEKKADKKAFKATYGKRAMRTCKKGEKSEIKDEIRNAAQECKAERAEDKDAFGDKYGTGKKGKNAYGKCVSSKSKAEVEAEVEAFENAAKECKSERRDDRDAFKETYGSNKNGKNALGKCVSSKVKDAEEEGETA
ncbi:MAG TPA: hypothetical protein VKA36_01620 [Solirubrobacterales bacterium]|nr:hypothetical protein [Solirubrobacterales bacterium]